MRKAYLIGCTAALVIALAAGANAQTGACIFADNGCAQLSSADCATQGGTFQGVGTQCPAQVVVMGATLFKDFFSKPASTNDFINVDGDTYQQAYDHYFSQGQGQWVCDPKTPVTAPWAGFDPCIVGPFVDQLAVTYPPGGNCAGYYEPTWPQPNNHWLVIYHGVGSGNGLAGMRDWALGSTLPTEPASDTGFINRTEFASGGFVSPTGCGPVDATGCPVPMHGVDLAVMDVPTRWFVVQGTEGEAAWNRNPGEPGYGQNPMRSYCCCDGDQSNKLKSLCIDDETCLQLDNIVDVPIAWVPIAIIANPRGIRGNEGCCSEHQCFSVTELRYLFLTGRLPNGENLVAVTRDSGSGTRNGAMNSLGIDPSWGRGDNCGYKHKEKTEADLGPRFLASNCGGSSVMEETVKNAGLGVGYTGLAGGSRAAKDAISGIYEVCDVMFDNRGGTTCVRPTIGSVVDNLDPDSGYSIGGPETFAYSIDHVGQPALDYLQNIVDSIIQFEENPDPLDPNLQSMPGQYLAQSYFLLGGIEGLPNLVNPTELLPNPDFNQALHDYMLANNDLGIGGDTPAFGASEALYPIPDRATDADLAGFDPPGIVWPENPCDCDYPADGQYGDGSTDGDYKNYFNDTYQYSAGQPLPSRNWIAGDFNNDGCRNIDDIPQMMAAVLDPAAWVTGSGFGGDINNPAIPEIIGDYNNDGNFDCRDIRYFCDGLALATDGCTLQRAAAFALVDETWLALTGDNNYFNTVIYDCDGVALNDGQAASDPNWVVGASAGDVAGATCVAPGAAPCGYDCKVDCVDAEYLFANVGYDWANLDEAIAMDLSCDMNGDLVVDCADVAVLESIMGCTCPGSPCDTCLGDSNCDGQVNWRDIDFFVAGQNDNEQAWYDLHMTVYGMPPTCPFANNDVNEDGIANWRDIDPFVAVQNTTCP